MVIHCDCRRTTRIMISGTICESFAPGIETLVASVAASLRDLMKSLSDKWLLSHGGLCGGSGSMMLVWGSFHMTTRLLAEWVSNADQLDDLRIIAKAILS